MQENATINELPINFSTEIVVEKETIKEAAKDVFRALNSTQDKHLLLALFKNTQNNELLQAIKNLQELVT